MVIECYEGLAAESDCSVEFFDMLSNIVTVITVPARMLRRPTAADRPRVRQVDLASAA